MSVRMSWSMSNSKALFNLFRAKNLALDHWSCDSWAMSLVLTAVSVY
jgi:hypothetical protein